MEISRHDGSRLLRVDHLGPHLEPVFLSTPHLSFETVNVLRQRRRIAGVGVNGCARC